MHTTSQVLGVGLSAAGLSIPERALDVHYANPFMEGVGSILLSILYYLTSSPPSRRVDIHHKVRGIN